MMRNLHPGVRWSFRFIFYLISFAILLVIFVLIGVAIYQILFNSPIVFFLYVIIFILLVIFFGEIFTRMTYNRWLYDLDEK